MEQNLPLVSKKVWSLVRAILFMFKKNISKRKLLLDLNLMMKRGKIAGKALQNLMIMLHNRRSNPPPPTEDYEFSCSNTPVYPLSLFTAHKKNRNYKTTSQKNVPKSAISDEHDEIFVDAAMIKALEMLTSTAASPAVSVFGKSPTVRQLRITDSPFPLSKGEEDNYVDEAADKFIMKFYKELRRQN
ncbi:hypothetical protein SSX86_013549 [Deinandra increscens subsp. villosa]|uniref:Avr9/Cf-9 rapidly elicited protein 146 n=1 Tax=Deinandra increscens subsp. villosa TaxID=3103831 RepID=A0AAP0D4C4_9ASTR